MKRFFLDRGKGKGVRFLPWCLKVGMKIILEVFLPIHWEYSIENSFKDTV